MKFSLTKQNEKIVILIASFTPCGSAREAHLLAREFKKGFGLDVEVWAFQDGGSVKAFQDADVRVRVVGFRRPNCPVRSVRLFYWLGRLWRVARMLRQYRVDVLLPFSTLPNIVAGLVYRLGGVRFCVWGERAVNRGQGERLAAKKYRYFTANSSAGVDYLAGAMGVPRERISLIPNGVEEQNSDTAGEWRTRLGMNPRQLLVVQVGDVDSRSDWQTLLRAWRTVQNRWIQPDPPLLAISGRFGDSYPECRRIVRETGLTSSVRFLGWIPDAPALIAASDLAVFSMRMNFVPNAVLECMIAGKAVVASDSSGLGDALGPGAESLTPVGDAEALAGSILVYLASAELRERMGTANRERARNEFPVSLMAERYARLIRVNARAEAPEHKTLSGGMMVPKLPEAIDK